MVGQPGGDSLRACRGQCDYGRESPHFLFHKFLVNFNPTISQDKHTKPGFFFSKFFNIKILEIFSHPLAKLVKFTLFFFG